MILHLLNFYERLWNKKKHSVFGITCTIHYNIYIYKRVKKIASVLSVSLSLFHFLATFVIAWGYSMNTNITFFWKVMKKKKHLCLYNDMHNKSINRKNEYCRINFYHFFILFQLFVHVCYSMWFVPQPKYDFFFLNGLCNDMHNKSINKKILIASILSMSLFCFNSLLMFVIACGHSTTQIWFFYEKKNIVFTITCTINQRIKKY